MPYRLVESSSDVVAESEGADLGSALVGLAQAFSHVVTAGSAIEAKLERPVAVRAAGDLPALAVAFVQELIYLFDTQQFLPTAGALEVVAGRGAHEVKGTLRGETFDRGRHAFGTEVKAATLNDAVLRLQGGVARARVLLDL